MLTGPPKEKSPPSRTKDNVDHAGLSQPPALLNHGLFSTDKMSTSLNNNLLTAQDLKETKDAMEDGHPALLTTLRLTESPQLLPIPMSLRIKPAKLKVDHSKSTASPASADATD